MQLYFKVDYDRLARHLHIEEPELRAKLKDFNFFFKQIKSNGEYFKCGKIFTGDDINDGDNAEIFLKDWRNKNDQSFSNIISLLKNMTTQEQKLLDDADQIKSVVGTLATGLKSQEDALAAIKAEQAKASEPNPVIDQAIATLEGAITDGKAAIDTLPKVEAPAPVEAAAEQPAN